MESFNEICSSSTMAIILGPIKKSLSLLQIIGPILCVISIVYSFIMLMKDPDDKKAKPRIKNSVIALIFVFFIPLLVNVVCNLTYENFEFSRCYSSSGNFKLNKSSYIAVDDNERKNIISSDEVYENGVPNSNKSNNSDNNGSNSNSNSNNVVPVSNNSNCSGGYCSVAHMGYSTNYTANTAASFEGAGQAKFWGAEADLRMSATGKLVCFHDNDNGLDSKTSFSEYLDICKKYNMTAVVDIKWGKYGGEEQIRKAVLMVQQKGMIKNTVFQCSVIKLLNYVKKYDSSARIWYLRDTYDSNVISNARSVGAEAVNINYVNTNQSVINSLHNANLKVCVYVIPNSNSKNQFLSYGADYIMSNKPV